MSCLNVKQKLLVLCCCAAVIALASSVMVINAFFKWKSPLMTNYTNSSTQDHSNYRTVILNTEMKPSNDHTLPMDVKIEVITQSSKPSPKHNWYVSSDNEDNDIIDLDADSDGSGSGVEVVLTTTILPIKRLTTNKTTSTSKTDLHNSVDDDDVEYSGDERHQPPDDKVSEVTPTLTSLVIGSNVTPPNIPETEDKCDSWLRCEDPFLKAYLSKFDKLPSCPCKYPLYKSDNIWDEQEEKYFKWRDSEYSESYLRAYHIGSRRCIRSEVLGGTLTAQNCCYDEKMNLVTRGSGAGTPNIISPDFSKQLHHFVDQVPWILCKGDWTRYNQARPPNNKKECADNPANLEFLYQIWIAKNI